MRAYQTAVTGGQYTFPDGLFYGGATPTWSNRTIRAVLRGHATAYKRLGWIDIHTGLGPRGHGEKIYAGRNDPAELARARAWWGSEVTSIYDESSTFCSSASPQRRIRISPWREYPVPCDYSSDERSVYRECLRYSS